MNHNLRFATRIAQSSDRQWSLTAFNADQGEFVDSFRDHIDRARRRIATGVTPVVIVDNLAEYLSSIVFRGDSMTPLQDMVCLRLPYDEMFFEWIVPVSQLKNRNEDAYDVRLGGVYVIQKPMDKLPFAISVDREKQFADFDRSEAIGWLECTALGWTATEHRSCKANTLLADTRRYFVILGKDGQPGQMGGLVSPEAAKTVSVESKLDTIASVRTRVYPALYAINAMHCRNVVQQDAPAEFNPPDKWLRRQKVPKLIFKTLKIGGMRDIVKRPTPMTAAELTHAADMALHTVRGHFKRFTEERKLMGKHVGIYWWHPQMRGKMEAGEIVKDYEIREEEHSV